MILSLSSSRPSSSRADTLTISMFGNSRVTTSQVLSIPELSMRSILLRTPMIIWSLLSIPSPACFLPVCALPMFLAFSRSTIIPKQVSTFRRISSSLSVPSMTKTTMSDRKTSSMVELKALIIQGGRFSRNPMVSVRRIRGWFVPNLRVVVERVANMRSSTRTFSLVRALKRVLFPAFV